MSVTIQVLWSNPYDNNEPWNELLAWTVETFGLPGERVEFHPTHDYMNFTFSDESDALMFQLKTAGRRLSKEEVTVQYIGNIINGR